MCRHDATGAQAAATEHNARGATFLSFNPFFFKIPIPSVSKKKKSVSNVSEWRRKEEEISCLPSSEYFIFYSCLCCFALKSREFAFRYLTLRLLWHFSSVEICRQWFDEV